MRQAALAMALALALPAAAQDAPVAVFPEAVIDLRAGLALPEAETVRHKGRTFAVRFLPEGGFGYTRQPDGTEGDFRTDLFLVGGARSKMEAVAVYLRYCRGTRRVAEGWGDEYVPQVAGTGEYAFQYPADCPAWRKRHG